MHVFRKRNRWVIQNKQPYCGTIFLLSFGNILRSFSIQMISNMLTKPSSIFYSCIFYWSIISLTKLFGLSREKFGLLRLKLMLLFFYIRAENNILWAEMTMVRYSAYTNWDWLGNRYLMVVFRWKLFLSDLQIL